MRGQSWRSYEISKAKYEPEVGKQAMEMHEKLENSRQKEFTDLEKRILQAPASRRQGCAHFRRPVQEAQETS